MNIKQQAALLRCLLLDKSLPIDLVKREVKYRVKWVLMQQNFQTF
jgi:hypothetical protein